jgi:hypothetical protein
LIMKAPSVSPPATRELPVRQLPACRCGKQQSGEWKGGSETHWLMIKPEEGPEKEAALIEYECLSCKRRYRLRGAKLYEVLTDGSERAYMRQGQYGRWLSCR